MILQYSGKDGSTRAAHAYDLGLRRGDLTGQGPGAPARHPVPQSHPPEWRSALPIQGRARPVGSSRGAAHFAPSALCPQPSSGRGSCCRSCGWLAASLH
jgi:hypothetical protein